MAQVRLVAHVRLNRSVAQVRAALFRANLGLPSAFIEIVDSRFGPTLKNKLGNLGQLGPSNLLSLK